jgi:N-acetylneuraminate lyase
MIDAFEKGDLIRAQDRQQESIEMIRLLGKYGGIATGKAYMKLIGVDCGEFRLPVKNMTADGFQLFKLDTEKINFKKYASQVPVAVKGRI